MSYTPAVDTTPGPPSLTRVDVAASGQLQVNGPQRSLLGFHGKDLRLIFNIFKMQLRDRYLSSGLGLAWAVLQPLALLALYTFVFGFVFKTRLPGAESAFAYVAWFICGFVPFLAITDSLATTASAVVGGAALVKNLVFKSEGLCLAATLVSFVPVLVGLPFLAVLLIIDGNLPTWHALLVVPWLLVQFTFLAGVGLFLGATTVYLRDVVQVLPTLSMIILFGTPVFYPASQLPSFAQRLTYFNPFYRLVEPYRDLLIEHRLPDGLGVAYVTALAVALFGLGLVYFRRLKGHFEAAL